MRLALASVLVSVLLAGCVPNEFNKPVPTAFATMEAVGTSSVKGRITIGEQDGITRIFVDLWGLTGEHGFHVHEETDCRAAIANLSRGHLNPDKLPHGQHLGDLPNIRADVFGTMRDAMYVRTQLVGEKNNVIGRALIITSNFDDFKTQPDGRSGQAIACGIIQRI